MKIGLMILVAAASVGMVSAAGATDITLMVNNMSAKPVVALFATPKGQSAVSEANLLTGAVAPTETSEITIASADALCVYDLRIGYGDGSSLDRPDVDLCQTDELIID